ncbi:MAG: hypothetical protein AVDCRST_MAG30-1027, partial [uncultured Solirubrobacteraceae bacterium]
DRSRDGPRGRDPLRSPQRRGGALPRVQRVGRARRLALRALLRDRRGPGGGRRRL